jgi:hypothetical protein
MVEIPHGSDYFRCKNYDAFSNFWENENELCATCSVIEVMEERGSQLQF